MMADSPRKTLHGQRETSMGFLSDIKQRMATLRFQILGLVVVSVLVPSFLAGLLASNRISGILRQQAYRDIELETERMAEQILRWGEARAADIQDIALTSLLLQEEVKNLTGKTKENVTYISPAESGSSIFENVNFGSPLMIDDTQALTDMDGHTLKIHI